MLPRQLLNYGYAYIRHSAPRHLDLSTGLKGPARNVQTNAPSSDEIKPIDRSQEPTETKRRRLVWQTRKRGILESDLLLSTFASKSLPSMSHQELEEFDKLLDHMDWDIFHWASGAKTAPEEVKSMSIFKKLEEHCKTRSSALERMPNL